jgi:dolichyl-phosphate-mannose--protein O-mannosyl transferase
LLEFAREICLFLAAGFSIFHLLLIFGMPLGEFILGGKYRVFPLKMRVFSAFFFAYFVGVSVAYWRNFLPLVAVNTVFQAWAIIGNAFLTKSRKEKIIMTPLAVLFFVASSYFFWKGLK